MFLFYFAAGCEKEVDVVRQIEDDERLAMKLAQQWAEQQSWGEYSIYYEWHDGETGCIRNIASDFGG